MRRRGGPAHGEPERGDPGRESPAERLAADPRGPGSSVAHTPDPDARWLALLLHAAFFLLLGASLTRFLMRHPGEARTPWIIGLSAALALVYALGPVLGSRPTPRRFAWLAGLVAVWMVLVVLAPSFAWCAVPLFSTGLRLLPPRAALVLVTLLTAFVVAAQLRLATGFDPNLVLAPPAVAAVATAVLVHVRRQADRQQELAVRQRQLIDDLVLTRRELAATERREGTLAERQRLAMEIHDTLAQGLSSQRMLLQAADRTWETEPGTARAHVRTAAGIAARNLAEARRFVHDLAPADLAAGEGLEAALGALAARTTATGGLTVRCHVEGSARSPCRTGCSRRCCASPRARWPTSPSTPVRPPPGSPSPTSTTGSSSTSRTTVAASPRTARRRAEHPTAPCPAAVTGCPRYAPGYSSSADG